MDRDDKLDDQEKSTRQLEKTDRETWADAFNDDAKKKAAEEKTPLDDNVTLQNLIGHYSGKNSTVSKTREGLESTKERTSSTSSIEDEDQKGSTLPHSSLHISRMTAGAITQRSRLNQLRSIYQTIRNLNPETIRETHLENYQNQANKLFDDFTRYHESLNSTASQLDLQHTYYVSQYFEKMMTLHGEISEILSEYKGILQDRYRPSTPHQRNSESESKLPRMDLPKFSGQYKEWKSFIDRFNMMVGNKNITPVEKMIRLEGCLVGDAKAIIANLTTTNENYDIAMKKLTNRYENQRLIVTSLFTNLMSMTPMHKKSAKGLREVIDTTTSTLNGLKALHINVEGWDAIINHIMRTAIDPDTREKWEEKLGASTKVPSLKEFMDFLKARANALESVDSNNPINSTTVNSNNHGKSNANKKSTVYTHTVSSTNNQREKKSDVAPTKQSGSKEKSCTLCKGNHFIGYSCTKFKDMTVKQRREAIQQLDLCWNCLGPHKVDKCISEKTCRTCDRQHHTLIHENRDIASAIG
ncbi:uncharacterized protein LOC107047973 [Diachasma alloeum]|uniref:uncharacterized protein LOC107047973 n=1 Tax=Diachasma alloeum TaxID=454923 RepID=UPI0007381516|nr:uncharacterized protein LOC107047973 [Diachasma alloeum]